MKKSLAMLVLMFATGALAQTTPQQPAAGQAGTAAPAQQKKEIKNPAEYNAYMGAIQQTDPNAKASALEAFLQTYPDSVMKEDALELLMRTYQQTNNLPKTEDAANRLLQVNPKNVTALALLSYARRMQALQGGPNAQQTLAQAADYGQRGIEALETYQKPEGMNDQQFAQLKTQLAGIFNASVGLNALQTKDYPKAQSHLAVAVASNPTDFATTYQLALADLDAPQPDYLDGLWYVARAANLAPSPQYKQQIGEYGRRKYIKYHGGDDGWSDILAQAAASPDKPANFTIKPAPTPAEQAAALVQQKPVAQMSFDEIQMVMTSGNQDAASKVWNDLKDKPIAIEGKLISGTPTKLMIAGTYDDIQANKADIELTMTTTIPARIMPKDGATIQFQGYPVTYDPNPFMVHMDRGTLILPKGAETPKRTAPSRRRSQ
ncbi:MAG TPA: hypothetical protein VKW78_19455 [Terriglobales bacterium]|nr:hypothetical protein [Terriglobales bacterium]